MKGLAAHFRGSLRRRLQGYSGARPDVMALIEAKPARVLDVGCGAGTLGADIRRRFPHCRVIGVEYDPELARKASVNYDHVINAPVESSATWAQLADEGPFDLIVCADVLEHLVCPGEVLRRLARLLGPNGHLISSLPNVRHVSTFVDLYLLATWPRRDRGIHDRTHLHFYARRNILQLGREAGLVPLKESRNMRLFEAAPWTAPIARVFDFQPLRGLFTFQYLHRWRRGDQ